MSSMLLVLMFDKSVPKKLNFCLALAKIGCIADGCIADGAKYGRTDRHAPVKTPIETLMRPLNMHDRENDENPRVIMRFCQMMTVF